VAVAEKVSNEVLTLIVGKLPETTSVTGTDTGLFDTPAELIVMLLWYVAAARPLGITETLTEPGVLPDPGVTDSHDAPTPAAAVKARPEVPPMVTACAAGVAFPTVKLKLS
jgi:hypothetical protein